MDVTETVTEVLCGGVVRVPIWVKDFDSFRRWTLSEEFPENGCNIAFLGGLLWIDPTEERDYHNQLKTEWIITLGGMVKQRRLGRIYRSKMRVTNLETALSTEPDGCFVSVESLASQRVQLRHGRDSLELFGSPDVMLEVVSESTVERDSQLLLDRYHQAGIREYWVINPLGVRLDFRIYRWSSKRYVPVRPKDGWIRSQVFGQSFRLVQSYGELDLAEFTFESR